MSDDGSMASSYYSDDDETFEPLSLTKPKPKTNKPVDPRLALLDDELEDLEEDEDL